MIVACENCGDPIDSASDLPVDNDGKTLYVCWKCFWGDEPEPEFA